MTNSYWMPVALKEQDVHETPGEGATKRILEYHAECTLKATSDEIPWCSAFVNWVFKQVGVTGTKSAAARSWSNWGFLASPAYGCVVVLSRGIPGSTSGHVGFLVDMDKDFVWIWGGNQGDRVCLARFPLARIVDIRALAPAV